MVIWLKPDALAISRVLQCVAPRGVVSSVRTIRASMAVSSIWALTIAWLVGGVAGFAAGHAVLPGAAAAVSFLVLGGLVAADPRLSTTMVTVVAVVIGLVHGWANGAGIAEAQREALGLVGIGAVTFILVALASALVVSRRAAWARIVVRVAGSWIAAIGLLMLGWSVRGTL